ncbi:interleukin-13 isoform X2 [Equus asinus]|uniref:Interleukin-13 n=1 Tax=Equus przewalskii TaxID=9798 RepID=A0ABM4KG77_EQUPR|nr:interleukin-13 isoform X2 [Equus asinus]XP_023472665.1 interleukin-13 isoform X1 [Equus caballus]
MALWLTAVIALACLGGLASPAPLPSSMALKELIKELVNITQNQAPLCNGSMVWSVNLTADTYCRALESLSNVSTCSAIQNTRKMLTKLCPHQLSAGVSSERARDTKIEVIVLVKDLLKNLRKIFHGGKHVDA